MITRELLHDKVVRDIALKILVGDLTRLPNEADLSKELNVSRTILRESIKVLAAKGLVQVGHGGTRVSPREDWNLLDSQLLGWISENGRDRHFFEHLCELRQTFEPKAAELAAQRASEMDIKTIQRALEEMGAAGNDREAYTNGDLRFHQGIFKACHNNLFYQIGGFTKIFLRMSFALTASSMGPPFSASLPLHRNVLQAIIDGDAPAARKHMEEVVNEAARHFGKLHQHETRRKRHQSKNNRSPISGSKGIGRLPRGTSKKRLLSRRPK